MEKYFKNIRGNHISSIATGCGDIEIDKEEFNNIWNIIKNRPIPEEGFDYILKTDLTWDKIEVEEIAEDDLEISQDEFMNMVEEVL